MTILITGGSGKLGSHLRPAIPDAFAPSHSELNITDRKKVYTYFSKNHIDTVIHCAALTSIRYCEEHREEALEVNVNGTKNLYEALSTCALSPYFIYISTACVLPGDEIDKFYTEEDIPYPKNFYGLTKLLGERIVAEAAKSHTRILIVRTNFIGRGKWPYPSAFVDRFATYLYSDQVAGAIKGLLETRMIGLVHICGDKRMSMYDFARLTDPAVKPMSQNNYDGPPVTVNMCLASKRLSPIRFGKPER